MDSPAAKSPGFSWAQYVLTSTVLVCLGWGLRGYIGGGPLGAMIPGAFVALWLCMLLGIRGDRAAVIAAFGALGIGLGGEMTYGQTLGLLRSDDTLAWGLLGSTIKGGVWGLLGGAVFGLGFVVHRLASRQLGFTLAAFLIATVVGIALINQPKLIYFSNPIDKPRDEIWAGLLFGAIALLAVLHRCKEFKVPAWFAAYGAIGGMAGFGIGSVFMVISTRVEPPLRGLPWWKFMEFFFGALLGAALGAAAWRLREVLRKPEAQSARAKPPSWRAALAGILLLAIALVAWEATAEHIVLYLGGGVVPGLLHAVAMVLLGYAALASLLLLLAVRSAPLAWQTALTMTFIASVLDLQEDMPATPLIRWTLVWVVLILSVLAVHGWQRNPSARISTALLALMWACVAVAYARILFDPVVTGETADVSMALPVRFVAALWDHGIVHGIFTATAIYGTVAILGAKRSERDALHHP